MPGGGPIPGGPIPGGAMPGGAMGFVMPGGAIPGGGPIPGGAIPGGGPIAGGAPIPGGAIPGGGGGILLYRCRSYPSSSGYCDIFQHSNSAERNLQLCYRQIILNCCLKVCSCPRRNATINPSMDERIYSYAFLAWSNIDHLLVAANGQTGRQAGRRCNETKNEKRKTKNLITRFLDLTPMQNIQYLVADSSFLKKLHKWWQGCFHGR